MITRQQSKTYGELLSIITGMCNKKEANRKDLLHFHQSINKFYSNLQADWQLFKQEHKKKIAAQIGMYENFYKVMMNDINVFFAELNKFLDANTLLQNEIDGLSREMNTTGNLLEESNLSSEQADVIINEICDKITDASTRFNYKMRELAELKKRFLNLQIEYHYHEN